MKLLAVASALASFRDRRVLLPLFLGFVVLCPACVTAPPSVPELAHAPAEPLLEEGRPVERMLGGGERHEHRIAVEAGWYVRLEVEQIGVDVVASLLGPDGASLFSTDDPDGLQDREVLALIASDFGELRLVVTPRDPRTAPGNYRVELTARRPAEPGDTERAAAQKAMSEAWHRLALEEGQRTREAISLLNEAARLLDLTGEVRERIDVLNQIGRCQLAMSETSAALDTFRAALALSMDAGDLQWQARLHNNLASAFWALADYSQALDHFQRAQVAGRDLGDPGEQGQALYGIGLIYRDRGDLDESLRYLSEALPLLQARDAQAFLYALVALAGVHRGRGEVSQASDYLKQALDLSRSVGGEGEAVVLSTVAQFQRYRGELSDALAHASQARSHYQRTGDEAYEARALQNLGLIYLDLGDLDKAEGSYEEGLKLVAGKSAEGEARFLNSLGWILYLREDFEGALRYFERALSLSREKNLPANMIQALGRIGVVYVALGRTEEGLRLLQEELVLRREKGDLAGEARSLLEIGRARQALGDLVQAADAFRSTLDLGSRMGDTGLQAACLYQWAVLDRQRGDPRQALERVGEALKIIESVRSRVSSEKLRITYLASKRSWYELYVDLRMSLEEKEPGQGHAASALEASERARARGLLDLIAEGRIDLQEGITSDLKQQERELGARLSWIQEELASQPPESRQASELRNELDQAGEAMEQLEEEIRRRHPHYAEIRYPTPLRLGQVKSLLDERTALLEYFVGQETSFLFVVTSGGLSVHRLPPAAVLEEKVLALRATLERPGILALNRFRRESGDLYEVLLGPAAAQLASMSNLLISPDGSLSLVPFEALLTESERGASYRELSYLLRRHTVSYIPSASVLEGLREPRLASLDETVLPKELVAFGDPVYPAVQTASAPVRSAVSPRSAPELPGSGREVQAIAKLYSPSEVELYMGERATEENVKGNPLLQTARRIHFATHGFVNEARPQLSGLMLTRSPGLGEDGLLQVYEIFNLRLNADLVALSACETGLGEHVTGEGMIGLTRGFIYAGTRSLLVSLWPVSDLSTPELMTGFYRHLGVGTKTEALQQAKLERIGAGDEPYRWAPFILAGDPH